MLTLLFVVNVLSAQLIITIIIIIAHLSHLSATCLSHLSLRLKR